MKEVFLLIIAILFSSFSFGQTYNQSGFVKTKGRIIDGKHIPGKGLSGAIVQVQGRTSISVQNDSGSFSFPIPANTFILESVVKNGYELVDADIAPKKYNYSINPLYILMETPEQKIEDRLTAERKIRRTLQSQLLKKEEAIENMELELSEKQKLIQRLYIEQQNNEKIISIMAQKYAEIDYDILDETNRQIADCILNGRLTEADSIINSKGDINKRIYELQEHHEANVQTRKDLEKSEALEQVKREEIANDCYNKYQLYKMSYENDSALYYIKLRASLDTTNVEWLFEAAIELKEQNAIKEAEKYYLQLVNIINTNEQEISKLKISDIYNNLAILYEDLQKYSYSEEYHKKAINILEDLAYVNPNMLSYNILIELALSYNNLGALYYDTHQYIECEKYYKKAEEIRRKYRNVDSKVEKGLSTVLNNLALLYKDLQRYAESEKYYNEAIVIRRKYAIQDSDNDKLDLADLLNNMAIIYKEEQRYEESKLLSEECIDIINTLIKRNPKYYEPYLAKYLSNYSHIFDLEHNHSRSIELNNQALNIRKRYAELVPEAYEGAYAQSLENIASSEAEMGRFEKSEQLYIEALKIRRKEADYDKMVNEIYLASTLFHLGILYSNQENLEKSESSLKEAISIQHKYVNKFPEIYEDEYALMLEALSATYFKMNKLSDGVEICKEGITIFRRLANKNPNVYEPHLAASLMLLYAHTEDINILNDGLSILKSLALNAPSIYEPITKEAFDLLLIEKREMKNVENLIQFHIDKSDFYRELVKKYDVYEPDFVLSLGNLQELLNNNQKYELALKYAYETLPHAQKLAELDFEKYGIYLAGTYQNIAIANAKLNSLEIAETNFKKSITTLNRFSNNAKSKLVQIFAQAYFNLAKLQQENLKNNIDAEKNYKSALDLYRTLYKENIFFEEPYLISLTGYSATTSENMNFIESYKGFVELKDIILKKYQQSSNNQALRDFYANILGNLSFVSIMISKFEDAEGYAKEAVSLNPELMFVQTNLALSLLLQGEFDNAKSIYLKYKETLRESFLSDIDLILKRGIAPKERDNDIKKIIKLLND